MVKQRVRRLSALRAAVQPAMVDKFPERRAAELAAAELAGAGRHTRTRRTLEEDSDAIIVNTVNKALQAGHGKANRLWPALDPDVVGHASASAPTTAVLRQG